MDNENTAPLWLPEEMSHELLDKALSQELKKKLDEALSGLGEAERKEFEEALELWITYGGS